MESEHNLEMGLTREEVLYREKQGLSNKDKTAKTKSIPAIIRDNVFTLFNLLNFCLGFLVLLTGSYKNMLFLGVVFCNTMISTIQEIRSKKIVDKLSLLATSKADVLRDGKRQAISLDEIVLDDILYYQLGNQVVVDSTILKGTCEVNEAFLTGETEPVVKKKGDTILSGSFLVSGEVVCYASRVGLESYTSKITSSAREFKKVDSEMMKSLKKVIKVISICIVPLGLFLFLKQYFIMHYSIYESLLHTVAALLGMIPEGLILLTSTVLAVSVIRLSKYHVLVQELYCIESLAYVDTLCLDKTGTITEGTMQVESLIPVGIPEAELKEQLATFLSLTPSNNATSEALKQKYGKRRKKKARNVYPFSSEKKWSGVEVENEGSYLLGAAEKLLLTKDLEKIKSYEKDYRVLVFCHSNEYFKEKKLPNNIELKGILLLSDKIRPTAKKTLSFFKKEGVDIKFLSGDSVPTVETIAAKVGIQGFAVDASELKEEELEEAVSKYTIFGRVSPERKKEIVFALKKQGHKVAMTGDGVNDVLALKEADCSIAMNSGVDAARNVAELVLLDSNFDALPKVLAEGRRTINNIERSASLFLTKTIYACILAILFLFLPYHYPFEPIQMSLTSMFTIGIPSFILALEPNEDLVTGHFLEKVLQKAFPVGITIVINLLLITFLSPVLHLSASETSTLSVFTSGYIGFLLLYYICIPFNRLRRILCISLVLGYLFAFTTLRELYSLAVVDLRLFLFMIGILVLGFLIYQVIYCFYSMMMKKITEH